MHTSCAPLFVLIAGFSAAGLVSLRTESTNSSDAHHRRAKRQDCFSDPDLNCRVFGKSKYRRPDGGCNNLGDAKRAKWGKAYTCYDRMTSEGYGDSWGRLIRRTTDGALLPNPRMVSNELFTQTVSLPHPTYSQMFMNWGQITANEISYTSALLFPLYNLEQMPCCQRDPTKTSEFPDCARIDIAPDDLFYGPQGFRCFNFIRSIECPTCLTKARQQLNARTSFIDASNIYGNNDNETASLREFRDGRLSMTSDRRLLIAIDKDEDGLCGDRLKRIYPQEDINCFHAGDTYANNNPWKFGLVQSLARQHNRMAAQLKRVLPFASDEVLFQEARRIVGAQQQMITFNEFLPAVLGPALMQHYGLKVLTQGYTTYDPTVNPGVTIEFSSASMRAFGHTLISGDTRRAYQNGTSFIMPLKFNYEYLHGFVSMGYLDAYNRGSLSTPIQTPDLKFDDAIRNFMESFARNGPPYGVDMTAIDLQRGRDHGVPSYSAMRNFCSGQPLTSFQGLKGSMSDDTITKLQSVYASVEDIDLYVGGLAEYHVAGGLVGPTLGCVWGKQFHNLKYGDRYYFEHGVQSGSFTPGQLDSIRKMTVAKLICANGDNYPQETIQGRAMEMPSVSNREEKCGHWPDINIREWGPLSRPSVVPLGLAQLEQTFSLYMNVLTRAIGTLARVG